MLRAGVSTACLYPKLLENSLYDLAVSGISCVEIMTNSDSELNRAFICALRDMLTRFDISCPSFHTHTGALETMLFFSEYPRRLRDGLEAYKRYFEAMNLLGAEVYVFHGAKAGSVSSVPFYAERLGELVRLGQRFGITVAQENVCYCESGSLRFLKALAAELGDDAHFVVDTKQAVRSKENPFDLVRALGSRIACVHISDHSELGDCLPLGKGRFAVRAFLKALIDAQADCPVMLELYRGGFDSITDLVSGFHTLEAGIHSLSAAQT